MMPDNHPDALFKTIIDGVEYIGFLCEGCQGKKTVDKLVESWIGQGILELTACSKCKDSEFPGYTLRKASKIKPFFQFNHDWHTDESFITIARFNNDR